MGICHNLKLVQLSREHIGRASRVKLAEYSWHLLTDYACVPPLCVTKLLWPPNWMAEL